MGFVVTYTATTIYKDNAGNNEHLTEKADTLAHATALRDAKLKVISGQSIISASISYTVDPASLALGHNDDAEEANLEGKSPTTGKSKGIAIDNMSLSYKSTLNDGTVDVLGSADIPALFTAYNAANGGTDYTVVSGRYE